MGEGGIRDVLLDFANALESASVNLRFQIKQKEQVWSWDPIKITWEKAQGPKGEFERSEDVDNPQFKAMLSDLVDHGGKASRQDCFYWVFRNGSVVGRKRVK